MYKFTAPLGLLFVSLFLIVGFKFWWNPVFALDLVQILNKHPVVRQAWQKKHFGYPWQRPIHSWLLSSNFCWHIRREITPQHFMSLLNMFTKVYLNMLTKELLQNQAQLDNPECTKPWGDVVQVSLITTPDMWGDQFYRQVFWEKDRGCLFMMWSVSKYKCVAAMPTLYQCKKDIKGTRSLDRTSWSIKSVCNRFYKMHMVGKMF